MVAWGVQVSSRAFGTLLRVMSRSGLAQRIRGSSSLTKCLHSNKSVSRFGAQKTKQKKNSPCTHMVVPYSVRQANTPEPIKYKSGPSIEVFEDTGEMRWGRDELAASSWHCFGCFGCLPSSLVKISLPDCRLFGRVEF
jgi:hypothetical protein